MVLLGPLVVSRLHYQTGAAVWEWWWGRIAFLPPFEYIYPAMGQGQCHTDDVFAFLWGILCGGGTKHDEGV